MNDETELLKKRFTELAHKSTECGYFLFTDFLGLGEQSAFIEVKNLFKNARYTLFGGAADTERVMVRFGDEEELGYNEDFPIAIIKAEPKSPKFADKLSHRDFLGALLNLGIERKTLGDIIIHENIGYIFCKDDIAEYLKDSLVKVKRTDIKASIIYELPDVKLFDTERIKIQVSGERVDAVISKVYSISRDDSLSLFKKHLVFVCGKCCENNSYTPKENDVISVRGYGRFIYRGVSGTSKKGKLNVKIEKYI